MLLPKSLSLWRRVRSQPLVYPADVSFNYLGDFSSYASEQGLQLAETPYEDLVALDASADVALQVELYVMGNYLEVQVAWCGNHYSSDLINNLLPRFSVASAGSFEY